MFKKHPIFCVLIIVCLMAFGAGAYLAFAESSKVSKAEKRIKRGLSDYKAVQGVDPAPTQPNVEASKQNLDELNAALAGIRENLQKGARMTTSSDGVSVMAGIQQFISEFKNKAATHKRVSVATSEAIDAPIELSDNLAFGFEKYAVEATLPEDTTVIPLLDKQRQILTYVLGKLYESNPHGVKSVERELIEVVATKPGEATGYQVDPSITARVPGAIDTMAFRIQYSGYTRSLRHFLNYLAAFELPIVVRSINVERPKAAKVATKKSSAGSLDDIFGAFGGSETADAAPAAPTKTPIIEDNISTFTLVLEFIEVVLPSETTEPQGEADAS